MPNPPKDMVGQTFGYLTVIRRAGSRQQKHGTSAKATWWVMCVCGREVERLGSSLRSPLRGVVKSCGCRLGEILTPTRRHTHGLHKSPAYHSWHAMKSRCTNPADKDWSRYGGRGITVDPRWLDVREFVKDMSATHLPGLTLERVDVNGNYCRENCCWIPMVAQAKNQRTNVRIHTPQGVMIVADAAKAHGLKPITVYQRIARGWSEDRLLEPVVRTTS